MKITFSLVVALFGLSSNASIDNATCKLTLVPAQLGGPVVDQRENVRLQNASPVVLIDAVNSYKAEISRIIGTDNVEVNAAHILITDMQNQNVLGYSDGEFTNMGVSLTVPVVTGRNSMPGDSRVALYIRAECR